MKTNGMMWAKKRGTRGDGRTYNDHRSCQRLFSRRHVTVLRHINPVANKHHEVIIPLLAYDLSTASILSKIALGCLGCTMIVLWKLMTIPYSLLSRLSVFAFPLRILVSLYERLRLLMIASDVRETSLPSLCSEGSGTCSLADLCLFEHG